MIPFQNLLSRADIQLLDKLLPSSAGEIIRQINPEFSYTSRLSKLVVDLISPQSLLLKKESRDLLIDLLPPNEAQNISKLFGNVSKNQYDYLKSLKFSKREDKISFLGCFGITYFEEIKEEKPSEIIIKNNYPLFEHQIEALRRVRQLLDRDGSRVLLHMPTGSGKTRTAINFASEYLRSQNGRVVVWLANSEELCEQAIEEFSKAWESLGNREITAYRCWAKFDVDLRSVSDGFIVLGLAKAYAKLKSNDQGLMGLGGKNPLVIFDEAHQVVAETYRLITELLVRPYSSSRLLGLSATPGRTLDDIDKDEELSNFFQKNKVTLKVEGYENPVSFLVEKGYLATPTFRKIYSDVSIDINQSEGKSLQEFLDLPLSVLKKLGSNEKRNLIIVREAELLLKNHKRVIVFLSSLSQSDLIATVLKARGHDAKSITSNTSSFDRFNSINSYKSDDDTPRILCNFGILTTGFDAPKTSAVLVARPTLSLVLYSQMVGRALRGKLAGGNESAEIVTIIDEGIDAFKSIELAFSNWEDVW
jgi:DNA repair protein RadD